MTAAAKPAGGVCSQRIAVRDGKAVKGEGFIEESNREIHLTGGRRGR